MRVDIDISDLKFDDLNLMIASGGIAIDQTIAQRLLLHCIIQLYYHHLDEGGARNTNLEGILHSPFK